MSRASSLAGLLVPALLGATAGAQPAAPAGAPPAPAPATIAAPTPPGTPAAAPPVAPVAKPKPVVKKPPKPPEPGLPDAEVYLRLVARSADGIWTMRIENEGKSSVRVPADARLLQLTIESGDSMAKKAPKPVTCKLPAGMRTEGFPEPRSLLLAPGEAYVESFDPRLFCFGKDSKALVGGAVVRARLGWDAPKNAKKLEPPFVVESTEVPSVVAPQKHLFAPPIVLSWESPDPDEVLVKPEKEKGDEEKEPKGEKADKDEKADADEKDEKDEKDKPKEAPVVDEHAPRIEIASNPYVDSATGFRVAITVTATNTGHRPALLAARSRMVAFRVDGPDGTLRCGSINGETRAIARDGYRQMKPGGSTSLTVIVEEACGRPVFRRPGLYRVTPSLRLTETGADFGLAAYTGVARAKEPTLVRVANGHDPYHPAPPKAVRIPRPDFDGPDP